jgi:dihydroorotate dehydrogenase
MPAPYRSLVRPFLFRRDSEEIHNFTLAALGFVARGDLVPESFAPLFQPAPLPIRLFGLDFPNPVGLAAGMDKQAAALPVWEKLGFGFSEIGGVTRHAQPGNPAPRMFRVVPDEALINRMGFNNGGADAMAATLRRWKASGLWPTHPVGVNLGKSKITPLEQSAEDYATSFGLLRDLADFFVVNVSSPNTPNLRQLQDKSALDEIFAALQEANSGAVPRPILVKVAPDLSFEALDEILELVGPRRIAGIVATNTTIARPPGGDPARDRIYAETGGLSGSPLRSRSTEVVRHIYRQTKGSLPIIGVGGIFSAADAWDKIAAGASLVQVYTGLVYEGPGIVKAIVDGLRIRLQREGMNTIRQAIGTAIGPIC